MPARVAKLTSFGVGLLLHDEARLLEDLANIGVELGEPLPEFGVFARVLVDLVDGIDDGLEGSAVGETFEERPELVLGFLVRRVGPEVASLVAGLPGDALGVTTVRFGETEEELDRVRVVAVPLLLDNDLLEPVDEPVAALLRELVLEVVLGVVASLASALLVLFGDLGTTKRDQSSSSWQEEVIPGDSPC